MRAISLFTRFFDKFGADVNSIIFRDKPLKQQEQMKTVTIKIINERKSFDITLPKQSSISVLKTRISQIIGLSTTDFNFQSPSSYFVSEQDRQIVDRDDYQIYVFNSYVHQTVPNLTLPSLLIREIEESRNVSYQMACCKLLNRLPNDPAVILSLRDMVKFIDSLQTTKTTNGHLFVYKLQILIEIMKGEESFDYKTRFRKAGGIDFLIEILLNEQSVFKGFSQILKMIQEFTDSPAMFQYSSLVISKLINLFPAMKKHKILVIDVLTGLIEYSTNINEKELLNHESFEKMITSLDKSSLDRFKLYLVPRLHNHSWLITLCLNRLRTTPTQQCFF